MVTSAQMTGLVMAIVLPILVGAVPYYLFWKKSSKIESGMMGAVSYGILGYIWQQVIYSFLAIVVVANMPSLANITGGATILVAAVEALASAVFITLALYWGVYLTNTKQNSLYRSATVGIGFGIGYTVLSYGFQLYYAIRINSGTYTGAETTKANVLGTSPGMLYVASFRNILMVIIFMGVALVMGKYYLEKNRLTACAVPVIVYVFMRFTDVIMNTYLPVIVARTIMCVILTLMSVAVIWFVRRWMQTGELQISIR